MVDATLTTVQRRYRPSAHDGSISMVMGGLLVRGGLMAKVLPLAAGLGLGAGFLLLCLSMGAGLVYTFNGTLLFVFVAADLIFVLLTGRLRLAASYSNGEFRARDLRTGRVAGSLVTVALLALLIVGALPFGFGHTIRTGLSWYVFHK